MSKFIYETFYKFVEQNNGLNTINRANLKCPFCQVNEIGKQVKSNGKDDMSMSYATDGRLTVCIKNFNNSNGIKIYYIHFHCYCGKTYKELKSKFNVPFLGPAN